MDKNNNGFDLLRLLLAFLVLVSHSYLLFGRGGDPLEVFSKGQTSMGEIGVMGFFCLSGYLISASFYRSPNVLKFLRNRFLRLFPGYWFCLLVTAFVIAPLIFYANNKSLTGFGFTGPNSSWSFVYNNIYLSIRQWSIGGLLVHANYKESLNGSLWSLFPEFTCYLLTLVLGFFGLLKNNRFVFAIVFIFVYVVYVVNLNTSNQFGPTFLILSSARKLYTAYLCGTALFVFRDKLQVDVKGVLFLLLAVVALLKFGGFLIVAPLCISLLCIKGFSLFKMSFKYDVSYGLYIYAFPVQQLISAVYAPNTQMIFYMLSCAVVTSLLAFLSYVAVERPFLNFKAK
jgi:peptidoglycan/LPS O-acetylase OafA/YrhL